MMHELRFWSNVPPRTKAKYERVIVLIEQIWTRYMSEYSLALDADELRGCLLINHFGSHASVGQAAGLIDLKLKRKIIDKSLDNALCDGMVTGGYSHHPRLNTMLIHYDFKGLELVRLVAHELRHVWQRIHGSEMTYGPDYWNRPQEIDARAFAQKVVEEMGSELL